VDQQGTSLALSDFRGKVVVLAFLDPVCTDVCPLTAFHLRQAHQALGAAASGVAFLAVNVNPEADQLAMREATKKWGIGEVPGWHFLTGNREELRRVWEAYGVAAEGPPKPGKPEEREHTPGLYLVDVQGTKRWYLSTAFEGGPPLSELLVKQLRALLAQSR
jgi:cytochrome oxidase Cu insertion factor (SCO1/SenC/PrrC family)